MQSSLKREIKTQTNDSQKNVKNNKINGGVIFIDAINNSISTTNETKKGKSYWFNKYLQDLQKRGISQKIAKYF
ncbi:MAG: hypothetical protein ACW98D_07640 [Promethearchaeota archaeon]